MSNIRMYIFLKQYLFGSFLLEMSCIDAEIIKKIPFRKSTSRFDSSHVHTKNKNKKKIEGKIKMNTLQTHS